MTGCGLGTVLHTLVIIVLRIILVIHITGEDHVIMPRIIGEDFRCIVQEELVLSDIFTPRTMVVSTDQEEADIFMVMEAAGEFFLNYFEMVCLCKPFSVLDTAKSYVFNLEDAEEASRT